MHTGSKWFWHLYRKIRKTFLVVCSEFEFKTNLNYRTGEMLSMLIFGHFLAECGKKGVTCATYCYFLWNSWGFWTPFPWCRIARAAIFPHNRQLSPWEVATRKWLHLHCRQLKASWCVEQWTEHESILTKSIMTTTGPRILLLLSKVKQDEKNCFRITWQSSRFYACSTEELSSIINLIDWWMIPKN